MAFQVEDAQAAFDEAVKRGATPATTNNPMGMDIPAIEGIGGSLLCFVDNKSIYEDYFTPIPSVNQHPEGVGLKNIDHVTHNVEFGEMDEWAKFYEDIFGFRELQRFNIEGVATGLNSRAMVSPDGNIRIPINEPKGDERQDQIKEYLDQYHGNGIQHIALTAGNIFNSVAAMKERGTSFQETPDEYFSNIDARVPEHGQPLNDLKNLGILVDGNKEDILLQIFTAPPSKDALNPAVFFEVIERQGKAQGFGEGNFQALFEVIEQDQIKRGIISVTPEINEPPNNKVSDLTTNSRITPTSKTLNY